MNVKYIGIKTPAFAGFIALVVIFSGYCRMDFNQNDWLRQQVKLRHHPSPSFQLTKNSLQNKLFLIRQDFKSLLVAEICMSNTEALTLAEAQKAEEKKLLQSVNIRYTVPGRQPAILNSIVNSLPNDRTTIPVPVYNVHKPKHIDNKAFLKTLEAETHG